MMFHHEKAKLEKDRKRLIHADQRLDKVATENLIDLANHKQDCESRCISYTNPFVTPLDTF